MAEIVDAFVIGGGPAGLSAAPNLARYDRTVRLQLWRLTSRVTMLANHDDVRIGEAMRSRLARAGELRAP